MARWFNTTGPLVDRWQGFYTIWVLLFTVVPMSKEHYKVTRELHQVRAGLYYSLEVFGDTIAKREGYRDLQGMDAVYFYLIHKFHWLPRDVKSMSAEEIRFILSEEMKDWTLPRDAR